MSVQLGGYQTGQTYAWYRRYGHTPISAWFMVYGNTFLWVCIVILAALTGLTLGSFFFR